MDTPILLVILYLLNMESTASNPLHNVTNYLSALEVDSDYTEEKIRIMKKISPYMPSQYNSTISKSILITEKIVRLIDVVEFLKIEDTPRTTSIELESKDRLKKIVNIVQDEVKSSKIDNMGMIMELILNMDKYKKMLQAYNTISRNKNGISDINSIMALMEAFMDGSSEKDKEKIKEMARMMDIMKILDSPKKEKPNED